MLANLVVGRGDPDAPFSRGDPDAPFSRGDPNALCILQLSEYGLIVEKFISQIEKHYAGVFVDKYVIMPNHVHMIIVVRRDIVNQNDDALGSPHGKSGASGSPHGKSSASGSPHGKSSASGSPRPTDALIPKIMGMIKRLTNRGFGFDMWQKSYHDHIIRNETDYQRIWQYIDQNPATWLQDCYYTKL